MMLSDDVAIYEMRFVTLWYRECIGTHIDHPLPKSLFITVRYAQRDGVSANSYGVSKNEKYEKLALNFVNRILACFNPAHPFTQTILPRSG